MINKRINILLAIIFLISGCATKEYKNAAAVCTPDAFKQYPINNIQEMVTLIRTQQVPTGQTNCVTSYIGNYANTSCTQIMRTEYIPYQQMVTTDTNRKYRDEQVKSCAVNLCLSKYGNEDCDTKKIAENNLTNKNNSKTSLSKVLLQVTATEPDANGALYITIQSNVSITSLKINDEEQGGDTAGKYSIKKFAMVGKPTTFNIVATDSNGNTNTKTITVTRKAVDSSPVFTQLNPNNVKEHSKRDAVAIIIGIQNYKNLSNAEYANSDAQVFYDYAVRALGIPASNVKLLLDADADQVDVYKALRNWLPAKVNKGKTDVFVFYSGHGLPAEDGKSLYMLPHGADKDFIDKTAISQQEINTMLQAAQAKSITLFLDSCYSGQSRTGETLLASARPIALKAQTSAFPPDFTVMTATAPEQMSWSSPELKHGIFSYYLMKGMEGDADLNKDGVITMQEMQNYLTDNVARQAQRNGRTQLPQLQGDGMRVLVAK